MHIKLQPNIVAGNFIAFLLYATGGIISAILSFKFIYFFPIWIPMGIGIGIIFYKGIEYLPGVVIASLLTNLLFGIKLLSSVIHTPILYMALLVPFLLEMAILVLIHWYKISKSWTDYTSLSEKEVSRLFNLSFFLPILFVLAYTWVLYLTGIFSHRMVLVLIISYLGFVTSLLLVLPLYLSWSKRYISRTVFTVKQLLLLVLFGVVLSFFVINLYIPLFSADLKMPVIILTFSILFTISTKYSLKVFMSVITIFSLALLFKPVVTEFPPDESLSYYAEIFIFIPIILISALYAKGQKSNFLKLKSELKTSFTVSEDEIERQINEYKQLSDNLFKEIEKRGIVERELLKSKKLLTETQDIGKISSWEYSIGQKRFSWIYHNFQKSSLNINFETSTIKSIIKQLHPDDLESLKGIRDEIMSNSDDFNFELRLLSKNGNYNHYFISGRTLAENGNTTSIVGLLMDITESKLARIELEEKEQKYRALFDSNTDPVCVIDAQNLIVQDVNPAFEMVYEYKRAEIVGTPYFQVAHQQDETQTAIAIAIQHGNYRFSNMVHKRKTGIEFFVEGNLMSHMVKGKKMLFIISHDITNRKVNEMRVAEREKKFRNFFESDLIGMAKVSIAKQWISFNDKLTQMLGYSREELQSTNWDMLTHPDDRDAEIKLFNKVLTHEMDGYTIEKRFITKSGNEIHCKVAVKSFKTSGYTLSHLIMMVDDITDRKRAEKDLRESRAKLSQSQSVAKLGSIRLRKGYQQIELSPEAYEILGFGAKQPLITRSDLFKKILPDRRTRFEQIICDLENGLPFEGSHEQAFVTPSGNVKYLSINFGVSKDSKNQLKEVLATLADITLIKQGEIALKEANALKDQLFAIIGHDLRSPIGAINQMSEILLTQFETMDNKAILSAIEVLRKTSEEAFILLVNLLEWAKSQQTKTFTPVTTDLKQITNQVVALSQGVANAKSISIHLNSPDNAMVMVDEEMIKSALRNLINNSIKFTPNSGTITIDIDIGANDNTVIISIADTGVGISKENIPKLFDDKTVFSTHGTNREKGTGLGLKLVKKFVEKNGGSISVDSVVGQGTVFSLHFPRFIPYN